MAMAAPTSPLAALGITATLQPTQSAFWSYERLSTVAPDQLISALQMVSLWRKRDGDGPSSMAQLSRH